MAAFHPLANSCRSVNSPVADIDYKLKNVNNQRILYYCLCLSRNQNKQRLEECNNTIVTTTAFDDEEEEDDDLFEHSCVASVAAAFGGKHNKRDETQERTSRKERVTNLHVG
jgi:hypothetical protein